MSTPSLRPALALVGATVLSLGLLGGAVGHEEETSPPPAREVTSGQEATRAERQAAREERRAERWASREERKARRSQLMAAWQDVRGTCRAELRAIRANDELDRAARREALAETRRACQELLASARAELDAARDGSEAPSIDDFYTAAAADGTGVVRTDLGIAEPGSAPGEELGLWHYLIPAQTDLPPHTHPGWQLARVTDGELEYTVIEGEGVLLRGDDSESMGPGTYVLATGDGVIENPGLVHRASNRTDEPVSIISATLFPAGAELSTLVEGE